MNLFFFLYFWIQSSVINLLLPPKTDLFNHSQGELSADFWFKFTLNFLYAIKEKEEEETSYSLSQLCGIWNNTKVQVTCIHNVTVKNRENFLHLNPSQYFSFKEFWLARPTNLLVFFSREKVFVRYEKFNFLWSMISICQLTLVIGRSRYHVDLVL